MSKIAFTHGDEAQQQLADELQRNGTLQALAPSVWHKVDINTVVMPGNVCRIDTKDQYKRDFSDEYCAQRPIEQQNGRAAALTKPVITEQGYYCGAETKKGTPCSRRVKGNVRCFQHQGMQAMAAAEKLRIN